MNFLQKIWLLLREGDNAEVALTRNKGYTAGCMVAVVNNDKERKIRFLESNINAAKERQRAEGFVHSTHLVHMRVTMHVDKPWLNRELPPLPPE